MTFSLEFEKLIPYDHGLSGIEVDVELRVIDSQVSFKAKIDTGASCCVFAREYGESLGITIEDGILAHILTATGTFRAYSHSVTLIVDTFQFDSQVFFAESEGFTPNVLGRQGWLDRIQIAILDHKGILYLSHAE